MPQNKERFAIEISGWQEKPLEALQGDIASFSIEAGKVPLEKRINPVAVSLENFRTLVKKGSPDSEDQATEKIYDWAEKVSPSVYLWLDTVSEEEVLLAMKGFIDLNPGNVGVWISPPFKDHYKESRIAVYQVVEVNNRKYLFFRNFCGNLSSEECYSLALGLEKFSLDRNLIVNDPELIRSSPLFLNIPGSSFVSFLSKNIPDISSWSEVEKGKDIEEKINALKVTSGILDENTYTAINKAVTPEEQILIGRLIEIRLQEKLGKALSPSSCGNLYSAFSNPLFVSIRGIHSQEITARRKHCGKCGKYGYFLDGETCPYDTKD